MPKADNPHAIRLRDSVLKRFDEETADRITNRISLSKSAKDDKKFAWAEDICANLEREFDEQTVKDIRMDCACGPGEGKISKMKKLHDSCGSLDEFVEKLNAQKGGFRVENENGELVLIYPQCYCSCVKKMNKPISKAWCFCTLGYTKRMFGPVLGREVNVELVESVKTGGNVCKMRIT